jgi:tetrahydromethanopterin S-methyltransferase subunit G
MVEINEAFKNLTDRLAELEKKLEEATKAPAKPKAKAA